LLFLFLHAPCVLFSFFFFFMLPACCVVMLPACFVVSFFFFLFLHAPCVFCLLFLFLDAPCVFCFVASFFIYFFFLSSAVCLSVQQLELPAARGPRFALRAREQDDRDGPCARQRGLGGPRVARGARVARALDGVAQGGARRVRARRRGRGRRLEHRHHQTRPIAARNKTHTHCNGSSHPGSMAARKKARTHCIAQASGRQAPWFTRAARNEARTHWYGLLRRQIVRHPGSMAARS
jgi:hypothetical protein